MSPIGIHVQNQRPLVNKEGAVKGVAHALNSVSTCSAAEVGVHTCASKLLNDLQKGSDLHCHLASAISVPVQFTS